MYAEVLEYWQDSGFFFFNTDLRCLFSPSSLVNYIGQQHSQIHEAVLTSLIILSHRSSPLNASSTLLQCSQKLNRRPLLPTIDLGVVMILDRLPALASDLGVGAGLSKAWIGIDFYLIQSLHLGSVLLPAAL